MSTVTVFEPTEEQNDAAVRELLDELGMTLEELRAEADAHRFRSEEAALAWFAISSVVD